MTTWNLLNDFNNCPDMFTAWLFAAEIFMVGVVSTIAAQLIYYAFRKRKDEV